MRLYPSLPGPLRRTLLVDAAAVLTLLLFAWLGFKVHDSVLELNSLSRGVTQAGVGVQDTLRQAGEAVGGAPIVGGSLRDALQGAGGQTGGTVAATGREATRRVISLANLLGWLTFLIPAVLLLARYLPDRIDQVRRLTAGAQLLGGGRGPDSDERRRLVAQRAAFGLPYGALLRHTRDPLGDLEAGRYEALVAAELESAGLAPGGAGPRTRPTSSA